MPRWLGANPGVVARGVHQDSRPLKALSALLKISQRGVQPVVHKIRNWKDCVIFATNRSPRRRRIQLSAYLL
jgi:hypothetical protein